MRPKEEIFEIKGRILDNSIEQANEGVPPVFARDMDEK